MHLTCPTCSERFPITAGFIDDDGKRLAAQLAGMEPVLGRAVIAYLRLFKPAKQGLRTARAVKIVAELEALVRPGTVCRDERGGVRRPATVAIWAEGMEQMVGEASRLSLPLVNHHYLRAVVFGLADKMDAQAERERESDRRQGRHLDAPVRTNQPTRADVSARAQLREALADIDTRFRLKMIDKAQAQAEAADARRTYGGSDVAD